MESATTAPSTVWDAGTVLSFATGTNDILVLPRTGLSSLDDIVRTGRVHEYYSTVRRDTVAREVRFGFGELCIQSAKLATDIVGLTTSFLGQFGQREANLRIEITRKQSCPNFHCDNVNIRLVTTFAGPTTEYQYAGEDSTHTAPLHALVFLKGHRHRTHQNSVHHRSPEIPNDEKRLCLAIDF
jgi:hypothetical protein